MPKSCKKHGVIVDAAIHAPHTDSGSDERNYHAHIMFTTRSINEYGDFSEKKYRDFSRDNGTETVSHWRIICRIMQSSPGTKWF